MVNKREALRLLGSAATVGAIPVTADAMRISGFDSELVSVYRQWLEVSATYASCCREWARLGTAEADRLAQEAFDARAPLEAKIHGLEAEGPAGAVIKLVLFLDIHGADEDDFGVDLVKASLKALNGIVGLPLP